MKSETLIPGTPQTPGEVTLDDTVTAHRERLFDFIRRRIRNEQDAEDILQDVFYQLAASISVTEPIENLTAWLFTVARNRITDWYRKRRTPAQAGTRAGDEQAGARQLEETLFDPQDRPDHEYWRSAVWAEVADALGELPEAQRNVFIWHELEGRSYREIARMTGEPLNTLLSRKRYAVLGLRERLRDLYDELDTP
jgi:RNA polymerase sigma factor (sigma-70 family)